jgi:uracil-DNA glycosylase
MSDRFPFGAPLLPCPPSTPASGRSAALVLGVYPSALHVQWNSADGSTAISAMAVDNEPSVFWDGADQERRIALWAERWFDPAWGSVGATRLNGSSGAKLTDDVLAPLGLSRSDVWFTDAANTYFVKRTGSQGKAHSGRFRAFADQLGLEPQRRPQIPNRPTPAALVRTALTEHRERLIREIRESRAPLLITLGNEALWTVAGLAEHDELPDRLTKVGYGRRVTARVDGRPVEVLPLKHPGNRTGHWPSIHASWASQQAQG